jgi:hypothetical protein
MDRDTRDYFFRAMLELPRRDRDMILSKVYGSLENELYFDPFWLMLDDIQECLDRM